MTLPDLYIGWKAEPVDREGIKMDKTVSDQLVNGTNSDIRQIINLLSTWKLGSSALSFDDTKKLCDLTISRATTKKAQRHDTISVPNHEIQILS